MNMANTIAETAAEPLPPMSGLPRVASEIRVEDVQINAAGNCWREVQIRMPPDGIFADLGEPKIFKLLQANPRTALQKGDALRIIDYFEGWLCTCICVGANHESASISKPQRIDYAPRTEVLHGDSKYDLVWQSNGYKVRRKSDGHFVTYAYPTAEAAERALRDLYPQPANFRG
jgi:hypothetical protein